MDDKFILMNMDDARSKKIAEVLGNETCKKILGYLAENKEKSEEDMSKDLNMKLNTVEYNLKKLLEAGLVEKATNFFWSRRGKKINLYKVAKKHIVISPRSIKPNMNILKTIIPVVFVAAIALILILTLNTNKPEETSNNLKNFNSLEEIKSFLKENQDSSNFYGARGALTESLSPSANMAKSSDSSATTSADASQKSSADDYSTTNIQVEGVDEADIVKNDGKYIYVLSGSKVIIVEAYPAEEMKILSEINKTGVMELFINGDKLIIFSSDYKGTSEIIISTYDVSDRSSPKLDDEISLEGNYVTSRMIGNYVYLIDNQYIGYDNPILPMLSINGVQEKIAATDIAYFPNPDTSYTFTNVLALDLDSGEHSLKTYLTGASYNIYVSENNIYLTYTKTMSYNTYFDDLVTEIIMPLLSEPEKSQVEEIMTSDKQLYEKSNEISTIVQDYSESLKGIEKENFDSSLLEETTKFSEELQKKTQKTVVHKINVDKLDISYITNEEVPGYLLNQFSMDEYKGNFRIATTTGDSWGSRTSSLNHIFVLNKDLETIGGVDDLAKGERIYSTRFMGERAYMVTFRQVDPLFVIDLSNPKSPEVLGQLKVTGFSNYLHPYDENHIIGIGKEASEEGRVQGLKIALFDVSDVSNPIEQAKYELKEQWSDSNALYDHKAFLFDKEKQLLVLPVSYTKEVKLNYVQGEILVGFNDDVTKVQAESLAESYDLTYKSVFTSPDAWQDPLLKSLLIYVPEGKEQEWIETFEKQSIVDYAELNGMASSSNLQTRYEYWQGAFVFNINENKISLRGKIDHNQSESQDYSYLAYVQRSLYMDNVLYTISQQKIKANSLTDLSAIGSVDLPYEQQYYYGYGYATSVGGNSGIDAEVMIK